MVSVHWAPTLAQVTGAGMESVEIVKRVVTGDTFETVNARTPVRLPDVRSPGMHQHLGTEARWHLHQLIASGRVLVDSVEHDKAGRRLARVECEGRSVNREMKKYLAAHGY